MTIFLNVLFLIVGMALLIKGADFFVNGASAFAKKIKVPPMFIGLTIVALGTSLPELSVSVVSAINGSLDMSVGNVVGSNLFNMLFILGFITLFQPIILKESTKKIDFKFLIGITGALLLFSMDKILNGCSENVLSRTESILFLCTVVLYLFVLIKDAKKTRVCEMLSNCSKNNTSSEEIKDYKIWQITLFLIVGLAMVVFGGECVATTAKFLAIKMGMSEALVGLTIVAIGTSLPELMTSIVASKKGENDLALGNVIGSNILNISLILGLVGVIGQAPISTEILTDMVILLVSTIMLVMLCIGKNQLKRKDGFILLFVYIIYISFTIIRNYCF